MPYSYDRTAAAQSAVKRVLDKYWNRLHDLENALASAAHEYDVAASFRGGPGERDAKKVMDEIKAVIRRLESVSMSGGGLDNLLKADTAFTRKYSTPDEYADKQRDEMYPR